MKRFATVSLFFLCLGAARAADPPAPRGRMAVENKLLALPVGSIATAGWMQRHMAEDAAAGWTAKANQMSLEGYWFERRSLLGKRKALWTYLALPGGVKAPFYQPYIEHNGAPVAGEYQAHWMDAVFRLGWVAGLDQYRQLGTKCVAGVLAAQPPDGYLGVDPPADQLRGTGVDGTQFELWSYGETLNALLFYHRCTTDPRVLEACRKAGDLLCSRVGPHSPDKKPPRPGQEWYASICNAMAELYHWTGDKKYNDTASYLLDHQLQRLGWDAMLRDKKPLRGHTAGWGIVYFAMLDVYRATGEARWLEHLEYAHKALVAEHLQPHGAFSGQHERLAGKGPYLNTELCDSFWWVWCWTEMFKLTGETRYADFAEKAALNALPGQRSKDGQVAAYFVNPNQLKATGNLNYSARRWVECCHSNAPRTIPILAENMVLATPDGGLALAYFGQLECRTKLKNGTQVTLVEKTDYPFRETVQVTLKLEPRKATFPLRVRIPGWSHDASITINGEKISAKCKEGDWARLEREWSDGDCLELTFPASIQVGFWENGTARAAYLERGPLLYALPVNGDKKAFDQWGSFDERARADSLWNYALRLDAKAPASSVRVKELALPAGGHVWEHSPLALEVEAQRVPDWTFTAAAAARRPGPELPAQPLKLAAPVEKIQLLPYGFTTLRMTYLPVVKSGE